ncbi:hypothetical protein ACYJ1Y_06560 [Natrialbaceae archaeon A-gly3]
MSVERLSELVVPDEPVDPERLSRYLGQYLRISTDGDRFVYQEAYSSLPPEEKIIVILAGELARSSLGLSDDEWLTPMEISRLTNLELGTAYPVLRQLEQRDFVENDGGRYRIPPSEFWSVVERVGDSS